MLTVNELVRTLNNDFDFRETDPIQICDSYTGAHFRSGEYGNLLLGSDTSPYSYRDVMNAEVTTTDIDSDGKINLYVTI